jgi:hypothetical protein
MSNFRIYIYGSEKDYHNTLKFLPQNDKAFIHIKSIKEFIKDSKEHDTMDKSAILRAGLAVSIGFYEYFSAFGIIDNGVVFCKLHKALDAPINGEFQRSIMIDDKINSNFIMSNSHLLSELIQDGWAEFNNNIKELDIQTHIDNKFHIYEIDDNLISKHIENHSIFNKIKQIYNDINILQENAITPELKASMMAEVFSNNRVEQNKINKGVDNPIETESSLLESGESFPNIIDSYLKTNERERVIKRNIKSKDAINPDFIKYYYNKYGN